MSVTPLTALEPPGRTVLQSIIMSHTPTDCPTATKWRLWSSLSVTWVLGVPQGCILSDKASLRWDPWSIRDNMSQQWWVTINQDRNGRGHYPVYLITPGAMRFRGISSLLFGKYVTWGKKIYSKFFNSHGNFEKTISNFTVRTVAADGLAPIGARASAGTALNNFGFYMNMWDWHLQV